MTKTTMESVRFSDFSLHGSIRTSSANLKFSPDRNRVQYLVLEISVSLFFHLLVCVFFSQVLLIHFSIPDLDETNSH